MKNVTKEANCLKKIQHLCVLKQPVSVRRERSHIAPFANGRKTANTCESRDKGSAVVRRVKHAQTPETDEQQPTSE